MQGAGVPHGYLAAHRISPGWRCCLFVVPQLVLHPAQPPAHLLLLQCSSGRKISNSVGPEQV